MKKERKRALMYLSLVFTSVIVFIMYLLVHIDVYADGVLFGDYRIYMEWFSDDMYRVSNPYVYGNIVYFPFFLYFYPLVSNVYVWFSFIYAATIINYFLLKKLGYNKYVAMSITGVFLSINLSGNIQPFLLTLTLLGFNYKKYAPFLLAVACVKPIFVIFVIYFFFKYPKRIKFGFLWCLCFGALNAPFLLYHFNWYLTFLIYKPPTWSLSYHMPYYVTVFVSYFVYKEFSQQQYVVRHSEFTKEFQYKKY